MIHPTDPPARTPKGFAGLGLRPEAQAALSSFLEGGAARRPPAGSRYAFYLLADAVRHEVHEDAASLVPDLMASLLRVVLMDDKNGVRSLQREAAEVRDRLNDAVLRARSSYARRALRPVLLDLADYMGRYDKTAAMGKLPGRARDWEYVAEEIRHLLGRAKRVVRELGADAAMPVPRAARGSLDRLLARTKPTLDAASATLRALALGPLPRTVEETEVFWQGVVVACSPALSLAKGLGRRLEQEQSSRAA